MTRPIGLYLHIPFCKQRCDFCAFYLEVHRAGTEGPFLSALKREMELYAEQGLLRDRPLVSVYFGGGTPSAIGCDALLEILEQVRTSFQLADDCEITVEAHPATMKAPDYARLRLAGVTRLSLGAESMRDDELARLGRPGLVRETIEAVAAAKQAGFANINLDLMYGLPGQTLASWRATIERCLELSPAHLACYALTVEEGTVLAKLIRTNRCPAPDESLQVEMHQTAQGLLEAAGYERYEISNYAVAGAACRHNLLYWTDGDYLGLGPSAQSLVEGTRFGNRADLAAYQSTLAAGRLPVEECDRLTQEERLRDSVLFGFRLLAGVPADRLHRHASNFGHQETVRALESDGLIETSADRVRLTSRGQLLADTVSERLY